MKFTQIIAAITFFFIYASAYVIYPRDNKVVPNQVAVKAVSQPVVDASDDSLVSGLESIIPTIVSTIFSALGESQDQLGSVIPQLLQDLNLTSVDAQPLISAAQSNSTSSPTPSPSSSNPALGFIAQIVSEVFKILGTSSSTIISNLPGIISSLIKIFSLTVPDIISLFVGLFTGNPLSLANIVKIAGDVFQDLQIGFSEAFSIIQQIISQLTN